MKNIFKLVSVGIVSLGLMFGVTAPAHSATLKAGTVTVSGKTFNSCYKSSHDWAAKMDAMKGYSVNHISLCTKNKKTGYFNSVVSYTYYS